MKLVILIPVFAFFWLPGMAQFDFFPDSDEDQATFNLDSLLETHFVTKSSEVEFEFRLWTMPSLTSYSDVFILQLKAGLWAARYFEYRNGKFVEEKVEQKGLDSLWAKIRLNQVLSLPSQDSLRRLMRKYSPDSAIVLNPDGEYMTSNMLDGIRYRFELFSKNDKRAYEYHCPAGHLERYPNIEELFRAYAILILIRKHLFRPLVVC